MDKMEHITTVGRGREGFALIITLSVLSVVIALTIILLSYFTKVKEDAETTKALIQADIYYADILKELSRFKNKKSIMIRLYRHPVVLHSPDSRFSMRLKCKSLADGININWLALEKVQKKKYLFIEAQNLFDTLVAEYNLEDPDRLLEMLLSEMVVGNKYIQKEQSRLMQKNGIITYQQFLEIIKRYEIEVDDANVGSIPWDKYFCFIQKSEKIDAEYSSAELISYLFDIDLKTVLEWKSSLPKSSLEIFVNENGGEYNEKKILLAGGTFLEESQCSVSYGAGYRFTFDYIRGEAKYFEFHGKH